MSKVYIIIIMRQIKLVSDEHEKHPFAPCFPPHFESLFLDKIHKSSPPVLTHQDRNRRTSKVSAAEKEPSVVPFCEDPFPLSRFAV